MANKIRQNKISDATHLELHRAPLRWLTIPARIHVLGYLRGNTDFNLIKQRFTDLVKSFDLSETNIIWQNNNAFARDSRKQIIFLLDVQANHFTMQVWRQLKKTELHFDATFNGPASDARKLTELDILIVDDNLDDRIPELLPGIDILGSQILDGDINIITNFQPDDRGRERYLIFPNGDKTLNSDRAEFIIDNVIRLENNFHLLSLPQVKYAAANQRLHEIEVSAAEILNTINQELAAASTDTLKQWLNDLTAGFTELAKLTEEFNRYFADAVIYKDVLRTIFTDFREQPLKGYAPLSAPILRSTTSISADYARLLSRIESIRKQKTGIISILSTKIDLLQRDQSFALQCSMHENTKTQLSMQRSIEGLYVFIVAFYLTELARIVFEALESRGIIHYPPIILAAAFIPIAIFAGLLLSGKARHWLDSLQKYRQKSRT